MRRARIEGTRSGKAIGRPRAVFRRDEVRELGAQGMATNSRHEQDQLTCDTVHSWVVTEAGEGTVAVAEAFPKPGVTAVIVAEPAPTPVTGTFTLVAPAANVTLPGTVAAPVLFELRLAVNPAGAGPDRPSRIGIR